MPLGTEVGLIPGDILLDGAQFLSMESDLAAPHFSAQVYCPNGWMDRDVTWYGCT